ncbi:MAG: hypothetical protein HQK54_13555, partial [Oligoflexales bacterium]|nr:hypothetical protein [Oligoflexales bacterium]
MLLWFQSGFFYKRFLCIIFLASCFWIFQSCKNSNSDSDPDKKFIAERMTTGSTISDLEDKVSKASKGKNDLDQYGDWEKKPNGNYWTPVSPTADITSRIPPSSSGYNSIPGLPNAGTGNGTVSNGPGNHTPATGGNYIPAPLPMPRPWVIGGDKGPEKDRFDNEGIRPGTPTVPSTAGSGSFYPRIDWVYIFDNHSGPATTDRGASVVPSNNGGGAQSIPQIPDTPPNNGNEAPGVTGGSFNGFPGSGSSVPGGGSFTGNGVASGGGSGNFPGNPNGIVPGGNGGRFPGNPNGAVPGGSGGSFPGNPNGAVPGGSGGNGVVPAGSAGNFPGSSSGNENPVPPMTPVGYFNP